MSQSLCEYDGYRFWAFDEELQVWLALAGAQVAEHAAGPELRALGRYWQDEAQTRMPGFVWLQIEAHVDQVEPRDQRDARLRELIRLVTAVKTACKRDCRDDIEYRADDVGAKLEAQYDGGFTVPAGRVLAVAIGMVAMLHGDCPRQMYTGHYRWDESQRRVYFQHVRPRSSGA